MHNGIKTLVVKNDTHDRLLDLRRRDETMNDIINRLIDFYKHEKVWKIGE
jgi:predicted CopG family antitoxin